MLTEHIHHKKRNLTKQKIVSITLICIVISLFLVYPAVAQTPEPTETAAPTPTSQPTALTWIDDPAKVVIVVVIIIVCILLFRAFFGGK